MAVMHFQIYSIKVQLNVFEDLYALSGPDNHERYIRTTL